MMVLLPRTLSLLTQFFFFSSFRLQLKYHLLQEALLSFPNQIKYLKCGLTQCFLFPHSEQILSFSNIKS